VGKDDIYFIFGLLPAVAAFFGVDRKFVRGKLATPARHSRKREILLLAAVIGSLVLSSVGWYRSTHPDVDSWRLPNVDTIYAKSFLNETVQLDGRHFDHCHFENVKLLYHGLGPVSFNASDFKGQVWVGSDNIGIRNFGIMNAELTRLGTLIQLHQWVEMDKNGNVASVR
jgi:hypothetical protein